MPVSMLMMGSDAKKGTNYGVDASPCIMLVLGLMLMLVLRSRLMPVLVLIMMLESSC